MLLYFKTVINWAHGLIVRTFRANRKQIEHVQSLDSGDSNSSTEKSAIITSQIATHNESGGIGDPTELDEKYKEAPDIPRSSKSEHESKNEITPSVTGETPNVPTESTSKNNNSKGVAYTSLSSSENTEMESESSAIPRGVSKKSLSSPPVNSILDTDSDEQPNSQDPECFESIEKDSVDIHKTSTNSDSSAIDSEDNKTRDGEGVKKRPTHRNAPSDIGGRRNGRTGTTASAAESEKYASVLTSRPELVCRSFNPIQWELVVTIDHNPDFEEVRQNGRPLEYLDGCYRLVSYDTDVSIVYRDGRADRFPLSDDKPLIFKFRENWEGVGRQVGRIGTGHYIVIVPVNWTRKDMPPIEQAGCTDLSFAAHYFAIGMGMSPRDGYGFIEYDMSLDPRAYEITGPRVFDDSEEGELYIEVSPNLNVSTGVVSARAGEEPENTVGWKGKNFNPNEQSLTDVLDGRQGRFFVRVYDSSYRLLDSGEFRYWRNLRDIRVNGEIYKNNTMLLPSQNGHLHAKVQFFGVSNQIILPTIDPSNKHIKVHPDGSIVVAPHPDGDLVSCLLNDGKVSIRSEIRLPRVWWCIESGRGDISTNVWFSKPITMTQQEFRIHAATGAVLKLRLPQRISSTSLGFGDIQDRKFSAKKTGFYREAEIKLRDFVDYNEIDKPRIEDVDLSVRFLDYTLPVIRISGDTTPVINFFKATPNDIIIGETVTLSWSTQCTEFNRIEIYPEIGRVNPTGNCSVPVYESMKFILTIKTIDLGDVTKEVTVNVNPRDDYMGSLLTSLEIRNALKDQETKEIMESIHFYKVDLERFLTGEFKLGRVQPADPTVDDIALFYEDMSDFVLNQRKYRDIALRQKAKRRAASTKRVRNRLLRRN